MLEIDTVIPRLCPQCQHKGLVVTAIPIPRWKHIVQCQECRQQWLIEKVNGDRIYKVTYLGIPGDKDKAKQNREMVAGQYYIEYWLTLEKWLEEHPNEEYREDNSVTDNERRGNTIHDKSMNDPTFRRRKK